MNQSAKKKKQDGETTPKKSLSHTRHLKAPWKPGESGNPKGRPKGSRNALGEAFISAMHSDFQEHGDDVIEKVRKEKPDQYLKVIASILPKELNVNTNPLEDMSDDELVTLLDAVRSLLAASPVDGTTDGDAEATRH